MRYSQEIEIHEELQAQGVFIPYLTEAERVDVNPLLINYHRANTLGQYEGLPLLVPEGNMPIFELGATAESPSDPLPVENLAVPDRVRPEEPTREIDINGSNPF
jgi:hypothetical protein